MEDNSVYVFGGFEDYTTSDSIQRYNPELNEWKLLKLWLPVWLAKIGAAILSEHEIMICGGIYEDLKSKNPFSLISNTYKVNLKS